MIPEGVEARLRAHVAAVLAAASVPASERAELEEELLGHLVQRWHDLVAGGADADQAAHRAIRDFGGARRIGSDLTRTYRGRFWASTVGVLLPAGEVRGSQPRIAWWLGASLRVYAVLYVIAGSLLVAELPPVRAFVVLGFVVPGAVLMFLAASALGRRQRWALDLAIVVNVVGIVTGAYHMATTPGLISLNVVVSGLLLAIAAAERRALAAWVRRSRPVRDRLAVAILVVVVGGSLLPWSAGAIPDPTQAGPSELRISAAMDCTTSPFPRDGTVTVEFEWSRTSLLPGGIARLDRSGDALVLEMSPDMAGPFGVTEIVDVTTGVALPAPEGIQAAASEEFAHLAGPAVLVIDHGRLRPGHVYRATWSFEAWDDTEMRDLQAGVEYWHADRFHVQALLMCDTSADEWHLSGPLGSGSQQVLEGVDHLVGG